MSKIRNKEIKTLLGNVSLKPYKENRTPYQPDGPDAVIVRGADGKTILAAPPEETVKGEEAMPIGCFPEVLLDGDMLFSLYAARVNAVDFIHTARTDRRRMFAEALAEAKLALEVFVEDQVNQTKGEDK